MEIGSNHNGYFPSRESLYLAGLGITHDYFHQPTCRPQVDHDHYTLDSLTENGHSYKKLVNFQQAQIQDRYLYNHQRPFRANNCNGLPALHCHPTLLTARQLYQLEWGVLIFDL